MVKYSAPEDLREASEVLGLINLGMLERQVNF